MSSETVKTAESGPRRPNLLIIVIGLLIRKHLVRGLSFGFVRR